MEITTTDLGLAARVQHLKKTYGSGEGTVRALDDVSVGIRRGQFTAIMGPSGSGKSTLMHIMAGLDSPTEGRAWIGDTEITGLGDFHLAKLDQKRVGAGKVPNSHVKPIRFKCRSARAASREPQQAHPPRRDLYARRGARASQSS